MGKNFMPWIFRRSTWLLFLGNGPTWIWCLRKVHESRGKALNPLSYSLFFQLLFMCKGCLQYWFAQGEVLSSVRKRTTYAPKDRIEVRVPFMCRCCSEWTKSRSKSWHFDYCRSYFWVCLLGVPLKSMLNNGNSISLTPGKWKIASLISSGSVGVQ